MTFFAIVMEARTCNVDWKGTPILLIPERAVYIPAEGVLLVSDLHLGKINHFRKAGIPVPTRANDANTETIIRLLMQYRPERMIIIGDLFHSHYNSEWDVFGAVVGAFPSCRFELVTGNHDILGDHLYARLGIVLHPELELLPGMVLRHEPLEHLPSGQYQVCGHLHPAITLRGKGRQSVTLPCFWFGEQTAVLPAFGAFTGASRISPREGDRIYAIADGRVILLPPSTTAHQDAN